MLKAFNLFAPFATTLLILFNSIVNSRVSPETQNRIDTICRSNEDYGFCNKVFHADIPQPDVDYVGLTKITIMEARRNASNTLDYIRAQIPEAKDQELDYYKVCEDVYLTLKQSFDLAFDDFIKGNYEQMIAYERDTPRTQARCVTIFTVPSYAIEVLNERNREMRILITMAVITATYIVT